MLEDVAVELIHGLLLVFLTLPLLVGLLALVFAVIAVLKGMKQEGDGRPDDE